MVLRQHYKAGEKLFVDWAGPTIPIHSRTGDQVKQAHLLVAVLGASSYTYAEATSDEQMINWLTAHMRAFESFGGLPKLIVPDNARTGVTRACRYDPDLNPTYHQMAMHYGVGVVPARPYKPRDKAKVESGVLVVERWIVAGFAQPPLLLTKPNTSRTIGKPASLRSDQRSTSSRNRVQLPSRNGVQFPRNPQYNSGQSVSP